MRYLYLLLCVLLWPVQSIAALIEMPVASLPSSTVEGASRIVIDGVNDADCSIGGGVYQVLCTFDGISSWVPGGSGSSTIPTMNQTFNAGSEITDATSANPFKAGDGVRRLEMGGDATLGAFIRPNPLTDTSWFIWPTFKGCIKDVNAGATMLCFAPSAGSRHDMYLIEPNYRPLATLHVPLNPRGAASGGYESIVTNQPNDYYLTVTDANTDALDFTFFVTNRMAGATTATFRLVGVSKNASPANNIALDCAMSAYTPGTDTYAAHVTTGEVRALLTPATQNRPVAVTTSAHTINGGPLVAGDIVKGSCEVHATDTTSTQLSDFRLEAIVAITLEVKSFSE